MQIDIYVDIYIDIYVDVGKSLCDSRLFLKGRMTIDTMEHAVSIFKNKIWWKGIVGKESHYSCFCYFH